MPKKTFEKTMNSKVTSTGSGLSDEPRAGFGFGCGKSRVECSSSGFFWVVVPLETRGINNDVGCSPTSIMTDSAGKVWWRDSAGMHLGDVPFWLHEAEAKSTWLMCAGKWWKLCGKC